MTGPLARFNGGPLEYRNLRTRFGQPGGERRVAHEGRQRGSARQRRGRGDHRGGVDDGWQQPLGDVEQIEHSH